MNNNGYYCAGRVRDEARAAAKITTAPCASRRKDYKSRDSNVKGKVSKRRKKGDATESQGRHKTDTAAALQSAELAKVGGPGLLESDAKLNE